MTTTVDIKDLIKSSQDGYRVDVVALAKKLNLPVYSLDLPSEQSGHIVNENGKIFIEVNRNHPPTRQRFTIAHEISHYLKHDRILKREGQLDRKTEYSSIAELKREQEADENAADILMPKELVKQYAAEQDWNRLTKFNSDMINQTADTFRVSRAMALTRLRELGFKIPFLSFA